MGIPPELQLAADWARVVAPTGGVMFATWRFVVRPKIVKPIAAGLTRVATALDHVERMNGTLGPNGGKSLADKVEATHALSVMSSRLMQLAAARVGQLSDYIERPLFECDARGMNVRSNEALRQQFGYPLQELLGSGWHVLIAPEDQARVRREWAAAVEEQRAYRGYATYVTSTGKRLRVSIHATPTIEAATGVVIGWFGAIEVLSAAQPESGRQ